MKRRSSALVHRMWISDKEFFDPSPISDEKWMDICRFRNHEFQKCYEVSNKGRMRCKGSEEIAQGSIDADGYHQVSVKIKGEDKYCTVRVHCAVATAFLGNPSASIECPTVHHLNHNKLDNRLENLCWISAFDNNQEGHGVQVIIVDDSGEHFFPSQKVASRYLGRHDDYVSEGISHGYKLTKPDKSTFDIYTFVDGHWIKYTKPVPMNRRRCKIVSRDRSFEFDSVLECDRFLNKPEGYVSNAVRNGWPVLTDTSYKFYLWNYSTEKLEEYIPKSAKVRSHSTQCEVMDCNGDVKMFPSISAAARYLNIGSENLRLALKLNKTVKDGNKNDVSVRIVEEEVMI